MRDSKNTDCEKLGYTTHTVIWWKDAIMSVVINIKPKTLKWRLNKWWTLEDALNRPIEQHKKE